MQERRDRIGFAPTPILFATTGFAPCAKLFPGTTRKQPPSLLPISHLSKTEEEWLGELNEIDELEC
jgi:hypothetical protein